MNTLTFRQKRTLLRAGIKRVGELMRLNDAYTMELESDTCNVCEKASEYRQGINVSSCVFICSQTPIRWLCKKVGDMHLETITKLQEDLNKLARIEAELIVALENLETRYYERKEKKEHKTK